MNADTRQTLSEQLVALRIFNGPGYLEMCRRSGLSLEQVIEVENGNPAFSVMSRYADALGYEIVLARRTQ